MLLCGHTKRHIVVDTLGLILAVVVHAANVQDRDGAKRVITQLKGLFPRLRLIWADGGYAGKLIDWVKEFAGWVLQIVKRTDDMKGFVVLPRRWGVERTFGWLGRCRRLSKDYEQNTTSSEAMILIANDRCDGPETWLMGLEPLVTARAPPWRPPVGILAFVKRGLLSSSRRKRQLDSRRKPSTGLELPPSHSRS